MVDPVLLCPGQGVQRVGMGKDLAEQFPEARRVFEAVDDALGVGLSTLMWHGPEEELTLTHNAQPAILAHTLAVHAMVQDAMSPVAAAGHSLGEYSAYAAAGSLDTVDAARLVRRRGELMWEAGKRRPGTMAVVVGLETVCVEQLCKESSENGSVAVAANINAPGQVVISGDPDAVAQAGTRCKDAGARRVLPLKVSGAFHSPLMEPAQTGLKWELSQVSFRDPSFPVIANATATPVNDAKTARKLLGDQLTAPVRWVASMERAAQEAGEAVPFVELGPGRVLTGLLGKIFPGVDAKSVATAAQVAEYLEHMA